MAILMAGIMLFMFQQGSRNALNNKLEEKKSRMRYGCSSYRGRIGTETAGRCIGTLKRIVSKFV